MLPHHMKILARPIANLKITFERYSNGFYVNTVNYCTIVTLCKHVYNCHHTLHSVVQQ